MDVVIAGGHGQIALALTRLLRTRGDGVRGLIRNPAHADDLREAGAQPVLCDLEALSEDEIAQAVGSADAFVFAAGAGPGSGPERKRTLDFQGVEKTIAAAKANGIARYVIVSSMGTADPPQDDDTFSVYLRAKADADDALRASGLDYTVVRPGGLTNDPPTRRVRIGAALPHDTVTRADVAGVLLAVLDEPASIGSTFELLNGETPVAEALATFLAAG